jgi:hypothetical protein
MTLGSTDTYYYRLRAMPQTASTVESLCEAELPLG